MHRGLRIFVKETDDLKKLFTDVDVKPFVCPVESASTGKCYRAHGIRLRHPSCSSVRSLNELRSILHGDLWSGNYEGTPDGVAIFEASLQLTSQRVVSIVGFAGDLKKL